MNPLFSISHIASSRHSPATFKPIIVAQGCSSALPGDTYAYHRRPTVLLGTTGRHLRPLSLPNGTGLTYSLTSQIHPSLKSLDSSPPPFKLHSPATFKPIIVAQRCSSALPGDTYAYHRRPTVLLGTTGRHFRPLLSPNGAPWHSRATLKPIIVVLGHRPDIVISSFLLFASFSSFLSSNICSIELSMNFNARKNATYLQN